MNGIDAPTHDHMPQDPPYSCIILTRENIDGKIFVENRIKASIANKKLCCFGGKREVGETPLDCIKRECKEELKWIPDENQINIVCDFFVDSVLVARFYQTNEFENVNVSEDVTFEEGREGIWVDVNDSRMSPWHQVALKDGWIEKGKLAHYKSKSEVEAVGFRNLIASLPTMS